MADNVTQEGTSEQNTSTLFTPDSNLFDESKGDLANSTDDRNLDTTHNFEQKTQAQISARGQAYEQLLKNYVKLAKERNDSKEAKKNSFYCLIKWILILSGVLFCVLFIRVIFLSVEDMAKLLPVVAAAFATFLGEFISLPTIVAKYLFNNDEDNNMTEIIKHTQDFDISSQNSMSGKNNKD